MKLPDQDYTFATLLSDTRNPDDAPTWRELVYAFVTVIVMAAILWL